MALRLTVKARYKKARPPEYVRFQANPPVCNICGQEITRQNFGYAYIEVEEHKKIKQVEQCERIECTACTLVRESGEALLAFLTRHHL